MAKRKPKIKGVGKYGWLPDRPDIRDLTFSMIAPPPGPLPDKVDLRAQCSPVEAQGVLGSCTANAVAGNIEHNSIKAGLPYNDVSRLFIYYNERELEGTVGYDAGGYLRDAIKAVVNKGYCWEPMWPYDISQFTVKPSAEAYTDAATRKVKSYNRLLTLNDMLQCLASGFPFVFGFTVYESFETPAVTASGIAPMPAPTERVLGGHAVCAVGYDNIAKTLLVRNSWGPTWGMGGYFTLPFAYVQALADDFWTIRM